MKKDNSSKNGFRWFMCAIAIAMTLVTAACTNQVEAEQTKQPSAEENWFQAVSLPTNYVYGVYQMGVKNERGNEFQILVATDTLYFYSGWRKGTNFAVLVETHLMNGKNVPFGIKFRPND